MFHKKGLGPKVELTIVHNTTKFILRHYLGPPSSALVTPQYCGHLLNLERL